MNIEGLYGVTEPSDNQLIARYFSRSKLKKLLKKKEIWFADINSFSDKHERSIPDNFFINWPKGSKEGYSRHNELKNKAIFAYISCWTKFDSENYALWKIYDKYNNGACIVTTVGKLKQLIPREDMFICEVSYYSNKDKGKIDLPWVLYGSDSLPASIRVSESYKIKPYMYEQEIRSIIYSKEKIKGLAVEVDIEELVDFIYLSPFASEKINSETEKLLTEVFDKNIIQKSIIIE